MAEIAIEHESLSRKHAQIKVTESGSATIQDLVSGRKPMKKKKKKLFSSLNIKKFTL